MRWNEIKDNVEISSKDILVVGFKSQAYILLNENSDAHFYNFTTIDNLKQLDDWFRYPNSVVPFAIICQFDFLQRQDFKFLQLLKSHPLYSDIPFITISNEPLNIPIAKALALGIDDNYEEPVDWKILNKRIQFLHKFKAFSKEAESMNIHQDEKVLIPIGKRIFDILVASFLLILFAPVLILIAVCIKIESRGPALYTSKRIGLAYTDFKFLKFRTMKAEADKELRSVMDQNQYQSENTYFYKIKDDPRITKIGKFLRKTSLDEIPQLINVIRGEMSIVGNRPLPLYEAQQLTTDQHAQRYFAPAGITGLWQVSPEGKENVSQDERIKRDVEYANKFSFVMDLKILFKTLPAMLQKGE